ncbi:MAG: flagellar hook-associated protein FlgL [candidate division KSB1 bacterium]|nr:flagellar hook-associated protein FlgL [candidate division KSB1 bacterium]MDQ7062667.1 flagellar hook-associated protein FlgL [candidate division KSB1 bacterium]
MRITNKQVYLTVLTNIERPARRMLKLQTQLSSGKRINRYSDDPLAAGEVERYRGEKASTLQYKKNITDGLMWMRQTEIALDRLEQNIIRAKALAVEAANSTKSSDDRLTIANEVNQILEDVVSIANANFREKYLFAGIHTKQRPFVEVRDSNGYIESVTMSDDNTASLYRLVGNGLQIQVNIPGKEVFNLTDGPISTLIDLRDSLQKNDIDGINASLAALDNVLEKSLNARTTLGSRMARMNTMKDALSTTEVDIVRNISELEDADVADLIMKLTSEEVGYRSAIGAAARIMQTNLVDILT